MDTNQKCGIFISSLDDYSDLWDPFFSIFFRYWPDCPYPVYLMSNSKRYNHDRVTTVNVGGGKVWGTNVKKAMAQIPTPYILFLLEDIFLCERVDTARIQQIIDYVTKEDAACVYLVPDPYPNEEYPNTIGLSAIKKGTKYRLSLRPAIWNKKVFDELIIAGESPWDMEVDGTLRSDKIDAPFLGVKKPAIRFHAGIRRGEWLFDSVQLLKKEGIKVDLSKRNINYESKLKLILDNLRKKSFARRIKKIPVVNKGLSWLVWKMCELKVNVPLNALRKSFKKK